MRIIAGQFKNKRLLTPEDDTVRPTSDRTRESLFNLLMHGDYAGYHLIGKPVADICCGTGAVGFEALSRGASHCIFVDQSQDALALAAKNAAHLGVEAQCQFIRADASQLGTAIRTSSLIFTDPPYRSPWIAGMLNALIEKQWLAPYGLICVEQEKHAPLYEHKQLTLLDNRNYGKAALRIYQAAELA
jgi:16S rRNA (guanine966-N2)-methyltransferase